MKRAGLILLLAALAALAAPASSHAGTFPGTNGKIAFDSQDANGVNQLFVMDPDGQNPMQLTFGERPRARESSWSGDGEKLAFRGLDLAGNAEDEIFVIDADGQNLTQLTFSSVPASNPSFSPDGQRIAFDSFAGGDSEIFVMDANGQGIVQLTDNAIDDRFPSFSPSGQKIVFARGTQEEGGDILVMDADGQNQTPLTSGPGLNSFPSWSPDGQRILFTRSIPMVDTDLYVMDADGQNQAPLVTGPAVDQLGQFSPDGQKIVFMHDEGAAFDSEIFVADANGQNATPLTDNSVNDEAPSWQPLNPPACELSGESKQKSPKQVSATLTCPENAKVTVSGELKAPKAPKLGATESKSQKVTLSSLTLELPANTPTPVTLAPDKKGKKLLKKALKAGKKPKGTLTAVATDDLGASASDSFAVKLKRKKK